jgi:hypothetical protein
MGQCQPPPARRPPAYADPTTPIKEIYFSQPSRIMIDFPSEDSETRNGHQSFMELRRRINRQSS